MKNPKAIIMGASSGMGKELAIILSQNNYEVGIASRRLNLLSELQSELPSKSYIKKIDIADTENAINLFNELVNEMGGVDLVIISSGLGHMNFKLDWQKEKETIDVNVRGFAAMAVAAYNIFNAQGHGHLVGISSIAAIIGGRDAPAYNASKAFVSNYLHGLRHKAKKGRSKIYITDVKPGFVDTEMAKGDGKFWVAPPQKAALQIYRAIKKRKNHLYVTKRWRIIAYFLKLLPDWLFYRIL